MRQPTRIQHTPVDTAASPAVSTGVTHSVKENDVATETRLRYLPIYMGEGHQNRCAHCRLPQSHHISEGAMKYCPEWRLRQLYGDR